MKSPMICIAKWLCKAAATKKGIRNLSDESHDFIMEEISGDEKEIGMELKAVVLVAAAATQVKVIKLISLIFCVIIHFVRKTSRTLIVVYGTIE